MTQNAFCTEEAMRRLGVFILGILLSFGVMVGRTELLSCALAEEKSVYIGGMPAGFTISAGGIQILGFCEVMTEEGVISPASQAELHAGDVILSAAGLSVETVAELNEILAKNGEKPILLKIKRGEEEIEKTVKPAKDKITGRNKIGVLIRDGVSGIGTVTYIDKDTGRFGALGHAVSGEGNRELKVVGGAVYSCSIIGVTKGVRGKAGELRGMFLAERTLGMAEKLCAAGIYGQIDGEYEAKNLKSAVATSDGVKPGKASIFSTVSGEEPKEYTIEIVKVDKNNRENKNYVVKITDGELIENTGGIVQGMSGSPIVQSGKLVGAITHVFVNDPTRGYGISIDKMLKE